MFFWWNPAGLNMLYINITIWFKFLSFGHHTSHTNSHTSKSRGKTNNGNKGLIHGGASPGFCCYSLGWPRKQRNPCEINKLLVVPVLFSLWHDVTAVIKDWCGGLRAWQRSSQEVRQQNGLYKRIYGQILTLTNFWKLPSQFTVELSASTYSCSHHSCVCTHTCNDILLTNIMTALTFSFCSSMVSDLAERDCFQPVHSWLFVLFFRAFFMLLDCSLIPLPKQDS